MTNITDFLDYEISEMQKTIERITNHLDEKSLGEDRINGQLEILNIQRQHLDFVKQLRSRVDSFDAAIEACRQLVLENENQHRLIAQRETDVQHSSDWWNTLHQIQYGSDFLHRIQSWQRNR